MVTGQEKVCSKEGLKVETSPTDQKIVLFTQSKELEGESYGAVERA